MYDLWTQKPMYEYIKQNKTSTKSKFAHVDVNGVGVSKSHTLIRLSDYQIWSYWDWLYWLEGAEEQHPGICTFYSSDPSLDPTTKQSVFFQSSKVFHIALSSDWPGVDVHPGPSCHVIIKILEKINNLMFSGWAEKGGGGGNITQQARII